MGAVFAQNVGYEQLINPSSLEIITPNAPAAIAGPDVREKVFGVRRCGAVRCGASYRQGFLNSNDQFIKQQWFGQKVGKASIQGFVMMIEDTADRDRRRIRKFSKCLKKIIARFLFKYNIADDEIVLDKPRQ